MRYLLIYTHKVVVGAAEMYSSCQTVRKRDLQLYSNSDPVDYAECPRGSTMLFEPLHPRADSDCVRSDLNEYPLRFSLAYLPALSHRTSSPAACSQRGL